MSRSEELEIEIDEAGRVKVHVKGIPGKGCLDYVEVFRTLLSGAVKDEERTPEYYEAETRTQTAQRLNASNTSFPRRQR